MSSAAFHSSTRPNRRHAVPLPKAPSASIPGRSSARSALRASVAIALLTFSVCATASASDDFDFSLHAYLTQAYGWTDGAPLLGLSEDGTFDYRSSAILFSFQVTSEDKIVVQLASESIGQSALGDLRDEIELDWAFYEHAFANGTQVRLGRVPIPFGIYNELRDVGTLLELYRPPVGIYFEGAFSSETVDGGVVSHRFFADSPFSLEASLYIGTWERAEYLAPEFFVGRAEDAGGVQLWLETPVSGLRFGMAYQHFDQTGGAQILRSGDSSPFDTFLFSFDADFARFFLRGEYQYIESDFGPDLGLELPSYYVMAGVRFTDELQLNVLWEDSESRLVSPFGTANLGNFYEDLAVSLIYRFSPHALVRFELHTVDTIIPDIALPPGTTAESEFGLVSVSASF